VRSRTRAATTTSPLRQEPMSQRTRGRVDLRAVLPFADADRA
jgi:hypothetical protein